MICHRPTASRQRGEYRQRPLSVSAHDSCTYVHKAPYAPPSPSPPPQWGPPVSIPSQALIPDVVLPKYQCREINAAGPYGASSQRFKAQGLTVMKLFFSEKERGPGLRVERPTLPKSMAFPSLRAICALCVCVSGRGTDPGCAPVSRSEGPTGLY